MTTVWYGRGALQELLRYCCDTVWVWFQVHLMFSASLVRAWQRCSEGEGLVKVWRAG